MEEIRNEVIEATENTEVEVYDDQEIQESEGSGILKKIIIGGLVGGAAIAIIKNRKKIADKIEKRRIRKLEKAGYVISLPGEDVDDDREDESYESEIVEE